MLEVLITSLLLLLGQQLERQPYQLQQGLELLQEQVLLFYHMLVALKQQVVGLTKISF
jgi:hypothetical protein